MRRGPPPKPGRPIRAGGCRCEGCADTPAPTFTDEWRNTCEVNQVAALPSRLHREQYLAGVLERRGEAARTRIVQGLQRIHRERQAA